MGFIHAELERTRMLLRSKRARRVWAALLATAIGFGFARTAGAEEAELIVAKSAHVDAPKVFYTDGQFDLRSEFSRQLHPLDETINYLSYRTGPVGPRHYLFSADSAAAELDFLGANTSWYMGPAANGPGNSPIWAGFGADADIPVEEFRDASFMLDLVDVDGPGRVEMFSWAPGDEEELGFVNRMFSSEDSRYCSAILVPGSHSHNYTVFSKPGRYELKYRAMARTKDGQLISSKDQILRWQVGGNEPGLLLDSERAVSSAAEPTFSIAPAADGSHLSKLAVDLGRDVTGRAEFTVDGYHFADVRLVGGVAEFTEFLSAEQGSYQVRVVDEEAMPLWTSQPLQAGIGDAAQTTQAGENQPKQAAQSYHFPAKEVAASGDIEVTVTVGPGPRHDSKKIDIEFSREGFVGSVELGSYDSADLRVINLRQTANLHGEKSISLIGGYDSWTGDSVLALRLRPHPLMKNLSGADAIVTESYAPGNSYTASATLVASPAEAQESPTPEQPEPSTPGGQPTPPASEEPAPPKTYGGRVLLDNGHVDIAARMPEGNLDIVVKDDTRIYEKRSVERRLENVALVAPDAAKVERKGQLAGDVWNDILAPVGQPTWVLPFSQQQGLVWPGYSTDALDYSALAGPVKLKLVDFSGPGRVALYQEGALGGAPSVMLGSDQSQPKEIVLPDPTHAHVGWAFTKPGLYRMTFGYVIDDGSRATVSESPTGELLVIVGDDARRQFEQNPQVQPDPSASAEPSASPAPGATPTEPIGTPSASPVPSTSPVPSPVPSASSPAAPGTTPSSSPSASQPTLPTADTSSGVAGGGSAGGGAGAGGGVAGDQQSLGGGQPGGGSNRPGLPKTGL